MVETKKKKTTKQAALEIYVGEEKMSVAQTVEAQVAFLAMQTPEKYIMKREGRGGLILEYVETNYVIGRLNATFFFNWDSEILEQIVDRENHQIAMKIRLAVRFADGREVKKDAWGGSDIKWTKSTPKKMLDFADDLKSAESDGIKKAASMLGVCWDVYAGLTSTGRKKKTKKNDTDDGFTEMSGAPDVKSEFRTIAITINKKKIMHTKYEALDRFKKAKVQLGDKTYYKILGEHGYEKANQLPNKDISKLYDAMADAYKQAKVMKPKAPPEQEPEKIEPEKKTKVEEEKEDVILKPPEIVKEPSPEEKLEEEFEPEVVEEAVFPGDEPKDQSLGFTAKEVEKEQEEPKPEMPLQREIMSLAGLEAMLVDKHRFKPDTICKKLKEMFGEDELIKLTRKQTQEAIKYFTGVIEEKSK